MRTNVKCVTEMHGCSVVLLPDGRYLGVAGELPFREGDSGDIWLSSHISHATERAARAALCKALGVLQESGIPCTATRDPD